MENSVNSRLTKLETQMERIIADIEDEKVLRAERNAEMIRRMDVITDKLDWVRNRIFIAVGAFGVISLGVELAIAFFKH